MGKLKHILDKLMNKRGKHKGNKMFLDKWKWKHNIWNPTGYSKSRTKKGMYSNKCLHFIACSVCLCFFMSVEKSFRLGCVVSTVTCHVCWFSEHSVPEMLAQSSLKPNTLHGSACLSRSFCTFLVTGHWTRCNHSTCWDRLGRDDVFPTAWL